MTDNKQVEQISKALDACFNLMMQPTYDGTPGLVGKRWSIPACSDSQFLEYRKEAERLYYEAQKLNKELNVQECDASKAEQSGEAGSQDLGADHYFFSKCQIFQGVNAGEYLDKEDFLNYANHLQSQLTQARETIDELRNDVGVYKQWHREAREEIERWQKLKKMAPPEKWLSMYAHYQEVLQNDDVAAWYSNQFDIANKERNELKEQLKNLSQQPQCTEIGRRIDEAIKMIEDDMGNLEVEQKNYQQQQTELAIKKITLLKVKKWLGESTPQPSEAQDKQQ